MTTGPDLPGGFKVTENGAEMVVEHTRHKAMLTAVVIAVVLTGYLWPSISEAMRAKAASTPVIVWALILVSLIGMFALPIYPLSTRVTASKATGRLKFTRRHLGWTSRVELGLDEVERFTVEAKGGMESLMAVTAGGRVQLWRTGDKAIYDWRDLLNAEVLQRFLGRAEARLAAYRPERKKGQTSYLKSMVAQYHANRGIRMRYAKKSLRSFDKAIALDPNNEMHYSNRGITYFLAGEHDQAIADFTAAIELEPEAALAYINRGVAYSTKKDYERAIADLDRAVELAPGHQAYFNRALAWGYRGDHQRALADYDRALELKPKEPTYHYYRGLAYKELGDTERARADLEQALRLNPRFNQAYQALKELVSGAGEVGEAGGAGR